jgi:hypothetical protein
MTLFPMMNDDEIDAVIATSARTEYSPFTASVTFEWTI